MMAATLTRSHVLHAAKNATKENDVQLGFVLNALPAFTAPGRGFALIEGGVVYAVAGMAELWDGVVEAWIIPTEAIKEKKMKTSRALWREFHSMSERLKPRRMQTSVRHDFTEAHRLVKFLGFQSEGLMKQYGPDGLDYVRYAKWTH